MSNKQAILLADHEAGVAEMIEREFAPRYELFFAKDGVQAVREYEKHAACIGLIIVDLHVPRLGGQAVTEWVHHIVPGLPVIVTSKAPHKEVKGLLRNPAVSFLEKPFQVSELRRRLGDLLNF